MITGAVGKTGDQNNTPHITIFTDGACSGNPGPGGWGALLQTGMREEKKEKEEIYGGEKETTNNRMELTAAINSLEILRQSYNVDLYTDSKYVREGITKWINKWRNNGWKTAQGKPVKNMDLWIQLDKARDRHHMTWHWVKGHTGHADNEQADQLARKGMQPYLSVECISVE